MQLFQLMFVRAFLTLLAISVTSSEKICNLNGLLTRDVTESCYEYALNSTIHHLSVERNVSLPCRRSVQRYRNGLQQQEFWALKMEDARGQLPSGSMEGKLFLIGSYDECLRVVSSPDGVTGQFCHINLQMRLPIMNGSTFEQIIKGNLLNVVVDQGKIIFQIKASLCLPYQCTMEDLNNAFRQTTNSLPRDLNVALDTCYSNTTRPMWGYEIMIIVAFLIIGATVLSSTAYHVLYLRSAAFTELTTKDQVMCSFSLYHNAQALFSVKTGKSTITCLNGLRVFGSCFIILGHAYSFTTVLMIENQYTILDLVQTPMFQVVMNFSYWVDIFFLMSGLLVSYTGLGLFHKLHEKAKLERSSGKRIFLYFKSIISAYVHRYLRITPSVLLCIGIALLWNRLGSGPMWYIFEKQLANPCVKSWWRTILYINNIDVTDMCLGITWYLANDFQFFVFSPFVLLFLSSALRKIGLILCVLVIVASMVIVTLVTILNHLPPTVLLTDAVLRGTPVILDVYLKPYSRMSGYAIGLMLGYILYNHKTMKISKVWSVILWTASWTTIAACVFLTYWWNLGEDYSTLSAALFAALERPVWCTAWAYVIFACKYEECSLLNAFLSSSFFVPLSRLTFQVFLVHFIVLYSFLGTSTEPFYFSHYKVVQLFMGVTLMTYLLSMVGYLALEMPVANLEKAIQTRKTNSNAPSTSKLTVDDAPSQQDVNQSL